MLKFFSLLIRDQKGGNPHGFLNFMILNFGCLLSNQ